MSKRRIHKVAVIGSGIMGSGIACHFANTGVKVLLLDIVPGAPNEKEEKNGLTLKDKTVRDRIVNENLKTALKSNPSPIYIRKFASYITTGNVEDDIHKIAQADWVIEVVTEKLAVKKKIFDTIEKYRKTGTLVTSNTSGIPVRLMSEGRTDDFQKHFCGTHFFNPPRYLRLFEIIPGPVTSEETLDFLSTYGEKFLGKTTIIAKDTPAFIGNRVGIFGMMSLFRIIKEMELTVEEVDKLTGPVIGRPKSATFRTVDVVGLDTLSHVVNGIAENCKEDESHELFQIPGFMSKMLHNNWLGSKTGQGFYKKTTSAKGKKEILSLHLETMEYRSMKKTVFPTLKMIKSVDHTIDRFKILVAGKDKAGEFYRKNFSALFAYVSNRVPEITDELYKIDNAMKAGFGWEHGPFQIWDAIGVEEAVKIMEGEGVKPAAWVEEMLSHHKRSFYTIKEGINFFYDISAKEYVKIPGQDAFIILDNIRTTATVFKNDGFVIHDLGDGILNAEFRSKMNIISADVISGLNKAVDMAEKDFRGLVVGNQGANFSVGANIGMIYTMAVAQEYDELNAAIKHFQDTMMSMRYSSIPVIAAPHGMALGGGCELSVHADKVVAAAETYIGLVEFGVGLIPGGGGTKEMTVRASDTFRKDDVELNVLREYFLTIGMARVATSAHEAFQLELLQKGKDIIVMNKDRQIALAKKYAVLMAEAGYTKPIQRKDIKVLGKQALGMFLAGTDAMQAGKYITEHDKKIANKLAWVMAGGDLSEPTLVSEQYLLDLEREAFLSLCTEGKTLERISYMLKKGKPLRN